MFIKIIIGIALLISAVLIYAALLPKKFLVSREVTIAATPEKIFPWINSSKKNERMDALARNRPQNGNNGFWPGRGCGRKI